MKNKKVDAEYGRVFAEIRRAKGYSQHDLEDTTVSTATISRFENGENMIGTDTFLHILGNMGLTASEFENIFQKLSIYHDPLPLQNLWTLSKAADQRSFSMLEELLANIKQEIRKKPHSKKYQLDRILVEATISRVDPSRKFSASDRKFLTNFLMNTKRWGKYEVLLFSWTNCIFDTKTNEQLFKQMISDYEESILSFTNNRRIIDTGLNLLDNFLIRGDLTAARNMISTLESINIHTHLLFEKMELRFDKARYNYLSGVEPAAALQEMWYYYDVLKYAGSFELANVVREEINALPKEEEAENQQEN